MEEYINYLKYGKKRYNNVFEFQYHYIKDITIFDTPHILGKELETHKFFQDDVVCKKIRKEIFTIPNCEEEFLKFNPFFEDLRRLKTKNKSIIIFEETNSVELELSYIVLLMDREQRVPRFSVRRNNE